MENRHPLPVTMDWAELREGVRATWYPAVPGWDGAGQKRIDRATDRLLANAGHARVPTAEVVDWSAEEAVS